LILSETYVRVMKYICMSYFSLISAVLLGT